MRFVLAWLAGLQLVAACGSSSGGAMGMEVGPDQEPRVSIRIQGGAGAEGGQTGGEGSCLGAPEEPLTFNADDLRALVLGRHETTLAHRRYVQPDSEPSNGRGKRMIVEVSARGEPEAVKSCSTKWLMTFPVEVKLSLDEPPLDVIFEGTLSAYNGGVAGLRVDLPAQVAEQMGMVAWRPEAELIEAVTTLDLWFGADGPRGHITAAGNNCGSLVFPKDRTCVDYASIPLPVSDAREALKGFDELRALPVTLSDGTSTTLDIELRGEPERLCGGMFPEYSPVLAPVQALVSARLSSADQRIDVIVEGALEFDALAPQSGWWFSAVGVLPARVARTMPYFSAITEQQLAELKLYVGYSDGPRRVALELQLGTFDANATGAKLIDPSWVGNVDVVKMPGCFR